MLSARAWLAVAGDNRFPAHQRRAAARHAIKIAAGTLPAEHLAALQLRAAETTGRARLAFLREALVLAGGEGIDRPARLAVAAAWIEAGGAPARVEALLEAAEKAGGPVADEVIAPAPRDRSPLARGRRARRRGGDQRRARRREGGARGGTHRARSQRQEGRRRQRPRPPASPTRQADAREGGSRPPCNDRAANLEPRSGAKADASKGEPATTERRRATRRRRARRPCVRRAALPAEPADPWERALAAARAGRGGLARRIAEQALRSGALASSAPRLAAVEAALRQGGLAKQALLLRRTVLEEVERSVGPPSERGGSRPGVPISVRDAPEARVLRSRR